MTPVLNFPRKSMNSTESCPKRTSAHLPVGKTVGHHHFILTLLLHFFYTCLPFPKIYRCLNILFPPHKFIDVWTFCPPPHILALISLCEVLKLTNLIRCLLSVLRGGDECDEVADGVEMWLVNCWSQYSEGSEVRGRGGERGLQKFINSCTIVL